MERSVCSVITRIRSSTHRGANRGSVGLLVFVLKAPLIHTALNVPTASSYPSSNCLQWTGTGQLCFVTKLAVHIIVSNSHVYQTNIECPPMKQTPAPGINFDASSVTRASPVKGKDTSDSTALGWFRTMIEFNKGHTPHVWTESSQGAPRAWRYPALTLT